MSQHLSADRKLLRLRYAGTTILAAFLLTACGSRWGNADQKAVEAEAGSVPIPVVLGPVAGGVRTGKPFGTSLFPLLPNYVEEEFFIQGTASSNRMPDQTAPYVTRILVRRPLDARDFNGTAVVEWDPLESTCRHASLSIL